MSRHLILIVVFMTVLATPVFAADDLCPDLSTARSETPGDMAGVQADIERLSLCVERAKLLKQLDDVAADRQGVLDKMRNPGASKSFGTGLGMANGNIPALPLSALPPLQPVDAKTLKPGEIRVNGPSGNPLDNIMQSLGGGSWKVRKIWGQGASMRAQLSNGSGTLINVVKGDPLPDGSSVETVSVKGVAISQNGKISDLGWDQAAATMSAPPSGNGAGTGQ